jgi:hypothetical protein
MNGHQSFDEKQPPQHMDHHLLHAHEYQRQGELSADTAES